MQTNTYWVGDVPPPLTIDIRDQRGRVVNLTNGYDNFEAVLTRAGRRIELPDTALDTSLIPVGRVILTWPEESVFTRRGEYSLQLRMTGPGRVESTTAHIITVKEIGKD